MMTVLELINALENARDDYDDPIVILRPIVGRNAERYEIMDIKYDTDGPGSGHIRLVISRIE